MNGAAILKIYVVALVTLPATLFLTPLMAKGTLNSIFKQAGLKD